MCDLFVLILTPAAWASQWVQDERQLALAKHKPFLTIQYIATPEVDGFLLIRQWLNVVSLDPEIAARLALTELARLGIVANMPAPTSDNVN